MLKKLYSVENLDTNGTVHTTYGKTYCLLKKSAEKACLKLSRDYENLQVVEYDAVLVPDEYFKEKGEVLVYEVELNDKTSYRSNIKSFYRKKPMAKARANGIGTVNTYKLVEKNRYTL